MVLNVGKFAPISHVLPSGCWCWMWEKFTPVYHVLYSGCLLEVEKFTPIHHVVPSGLWSWMLESFLQLIVFCQVDGVWRWRWKNLLSSIMFPRVDSGRGCEKEFSHSLCSAEWTMVLDIRRFTPKWILVIGISKMSKEK